ncbi:MAG: zinc ribbon domain-containing protein [Acidobacteria bacterium]|nr:MAG: zinc ribbon domain-containing protein [Acidobacteriota bacterium]
MSTITSIAPTGADYNAIFGEALRGGGVSDRLRDRLVREEHAKLQRRGWEKATIVSLLPFPLSVNLGELGTIELAAATPEQPVQTLPLDRYRISMRDLGDGNFTPVSVLPIELAKEVEREYRDTGGVFWYAGEGEPPEQELAATKTRMYAWYRRLYQQGQDAWSRYHQHALLTDRMRDAARALCTTGEIAKLPDWITITRSESDRRDCPMCGESIRSTAKICHFCRAKLAPEQEEK